MAGDQVSLGVIRICPSGASWVMVLEKQMGSPVVANRFAPATAVMDVMVGWPVPLEASDGASDEELSQP